MILCRARRKLLGLALIAPLLAAAEATRIVDLSIRQGKPDGGVRTVRVARDAAIELRVSSDEAATIHVHGYDVELRVPAGGGASVRLAAKIEGRFPVAAHGAGGKPRETTLLYLEVHPR